MIPEMLLAFCRDLTQYKKTPAPSQGLEGCFWM